MKDEIKITNITSGWLYLTVNDLKFNITYINSNLTDVPVAFLKSIYFALSEELPFTLFFDEEDSQTTISCNVDTIIYNTSRSIQLCVYDNFSYQTFALNLFNEMKKWKEQLISFIYDFNSFSKEQQIARKELINSLFNKIDALLLLKELN